MDDGKLAGWGSTEGDALMMMRGSPRGCPARANDYSSLLLLLAFASSRGNRGRKGKRSCSHLAILPLPTGLQHPHYHLDHHLTLPLPTYTRYNLPTNLTLLIATHDLRSAPLFLGATRESIWAPGAEINEGRAVGLRRIEGRGERRALRERDGRSSQSRPRTLLSLLSPYLRHT